MATLYRGTCGIAWEHSIPGMAMHHISWCSRRLKLEGTAWDNPESFPLPVLQGWACESSHVYAGWQIAVYKPITKVILRQPLTSCWVSKTVEGMQPHQSLELLASRDWFIALCLMGHLNVQPISTHLSHSFDTGSSSESFIWLYLYLLLQCFALNKMSSYVCEACDPSTNRNNVISTCKELNTNLCRKHI